jgi:hypothetical protein
VLLVKLDPATGQASITAGGVGEQNFEVNLLCWREKTIPLKFEGKYVVVPRPNAATISDKMNVVYRGVVNPMSISLLVFLTMMFLLLPTY